ncbi:putative TIM-barrel fold enzyme [Candidatus Kinetoplastibacterium desouzaii TCC079E]|uniref:Pyridoxal phosphate homeostasis protein n=1 Tax=Candidatus Kinetoplastidibacterium desouzai TCC079E TaxID=1208919 RepID=M1LVA8_9PROT|nr:YggS family pyridoxal phosphate-dependent enzyme [Candidatus Kinetoplastibacterium desouzaii]AGF47194.1 putative TIM-barrel fold enzyme [Candidatus Kinetoplastibacterium desouzaii TCC079E]
MNNKLSIQERFEFINNKIIKICQRIGRKENQISILPVSKNFTCNNIQEAQLLGFKRFGENRTQEIHSKYKELINKNIKWVMIGHLQKNKIKDIIEYIEEVQSLDSLELAQNLNNYLQKQNKTLNVMVQIKTSPEPSKYGLNPSDLISFLHKISDTTTHIKVIGLMTIAELTSDQNRIRECFRLTRKLLEQASKYNMPSVNLEHLSMGMSNDFEIAIEEGATEIRLGSSLFGNR